MTREHIEKKSGRNSILLSLTKENHVVLYNMANYKTNIATIQISSCGNSNGEKVTIEINRNNPIYEEFVKENLQVFNLSKEKNDKSRNVNDRWISKDRMKYYNWRVSAPESLAKELGFTRLEKIDIWPKYNWEYYRFIEYNKIGTIWVYMDENREKCIIAELDEYNEPLKNFEHRPPRKKTHQKPCLTKIEHDLDEEE